MRSRVNFVDLAGSERASKSALAGALLREANYINLSLHYLEQVIVSLQVHLLPYQLCLPLLLACHGHHLFAGLVLSLAWLWSLR